MEPLAERMRPHTLDEYVGQSHLVGKGAVLRNMIDSGRISSFILWGPPGVGKTTLAQIIANKLETPFYTLSAIASGVKDVRNVIEKAKIFQLSLPYLVHRRDTPLFQIATRFAARICRKRNRYTHWSNHREPLF